MKNRIIKLLLFTFILLLLAPYLSQKLNCNPLPQNAVKQIIDSSKKYSESNDMRLALSWAYKALDEAEKSFGMLDTNTISALGIVSEVFFKMGMLDSAIYYTEVGLKYGKELFKGDHQQLAEMLEGLGVCYGMCGRFDESWKYMNEALLMCRRLFKTDHVTFASTLNSMAMFFYVTGKTEEAEPLFEESLAMRKRLFNGDNEALVGSMSSIAGFYYSIGKFNKAEVMYKESLAMSRRLCKGVCYDLAMCLNNYSAFLDLMSRYNESESIHGESLDLCRRIYKEDHFNLAASIENMAIFYNNRGRNSESEVLYRESYEMRRRLFKGDHPDLAKGISNLAVFYAENGKYTEAEPLLKEALEMRRRIYQSDNKDLVNSINSFALFMKERGRYSEAEPLQIEALEMSKRLYKDDNQLISECLNNLGMLYNDIGRYSEAESLYKDALAMKRRIFKNDHISLVVSISNMGYYYDGRGNTAAAEPYFKEALEMNRRLVKDDNYYLAVIICNLASIYSDNGRYVEAETMFKEALEMRKRLFNGNHPDIALNNRSLADFYLNRKDFDKAELYYFETINNYRNVLNDYFPALSETEKKLFLDKIYFNFESFNSFAIIRMENNPLLLSNMFDNQLYTKSLLFNSTNKIRQRIFNSGDSILIEKMKKWISQKEFLVKAYTYTKERLNKEQVNIDSLESIANELEKDLSLKSELFAQSYEKKKVTWKTIQAILKPDEAAVELVRFRQLENNKYTDKVYYAFLIVNDQTEEHPDIVLLDNGNLLEGDYYNYYRNTIKLKGKDTESFQRYWGKIYEKLKNYKKIYFSADGIYNKISMSTLPMPDGKYLIENQDIQYLNSTKDILVGFYQSKQESSIYNSAVLVGNPNFSLPEQKVKENEKKVRSLKTDHEVNEGTSVVESKELASLPGTEKEIKDIDKFLKSKKWNVDTYLGDMALKAAVKSANKPRVLHIATHGFFFEDIKRDNEKIFGMEKKRIVENPLLRSGLFFTGANSFLKTDSLKPSGDENGFLTAYEAMNLSLDGTELVVLSACETGLGEIRNGEGVFGLRRAFQQAGAKSVIMSLWAVSDKATQELMSEFYRNWITGMTKREAFRKAQLKIKEKYVFPYFWGAFVMVGE